jgi:hypothetical protein
MMISGLFGFGLLTGGTGLPPIALRHWLTASSSLTIETLIELAQQTFWGLKKFR